MSQILLRYFRVVTLILLGTYLVPTVVYADARTEARRHFRRGMELIVQGRVDDGVAELSEAYEILPHPNVLYNIGRAYGDARRYEESLPYLERYIASEPPDRQAAEQYIAMVRRQIELSRQNTLQQTVPVQSNINNIPTLTESQINGPSGTNTELERAGEPTADETLQAPTEQAPQQNQNDVYEERVTSASASSQNPLDASISTTIITRQDIRLTGIQNIGELLRRVAGVQVMATSPSETNIGIRGFNQLLSSRVLMLINGRSTYADSYGTTLWANQPINVEDIERIEILRGPSAAVYGANAMSGVINIMTRAPGEESGTETSVGAGNEGQARGYVGTSGRTEQFRFRLSAAYQQANRYSFRYDPDRVDILTAEENPNLGQQDVRFRADTRYRLSPSAEIFAEGGVNYIGRLNTLFPSQNSDFSSSGPLGYVMAGIRHNQIGQVRAFWNHLSLDHRSTADRPVALSMQSNTYDIEARLNREFNTRQVHHTLILGGGYRRKSIEGSQFDRSYEENHYQLFFQDDLRFGSYLHLVAGFRMDKHPLIDQALWSPQLAFVIRPNDSQSIRLSGSSSVRTFSLYESYSQTTLSTDQSSLGLYQLGLQPYSQLTGSPMLKPERIYSAEIGYNYAGSDYFNFEVSVYYNRAVNLIRVNQSSTPLTLYDINVNNISNQDSLLSNDLSTYENDDGQYNVMGGELGFRAYPIDGLDIWGNYSLNQTWQVLSENTREKNEQTSAHQLNAGIQYRANANNNIGVDFGIDIHYASSTVWPVQGINNGSLSTSYTNLDAYYLLNGRVGIRLLRDRLQFSLTGYNITNNPIRQHPLGQVLDTRVMANASFRFQ